MLGLTRWNSVDDSGHSPSLQVTSASYRHRMLRLTRPLKDSVTPRRIHIEGVTDQKQIASAA